MRISNRNQYMSHIRNMQTTLSNLTNSNNRMSSQRKFSHAYEDVAGATKAMRLRKSIRDKEFYNNNIRDTRGRINSAEDALQTSVNVLKDVQDGLTQALNGTYELADRSKIADKMENLQKEVLALMNASYTDHFVFDAAGGPNKGEPPFTIGVPRIPQMVNGTAYSYTIKDGVNLYDENGTQITDVLRTSENQVPLQVYTSPAGAGDPASLKLLQTEGDFATYFEMHKVTGVEVQKMDYTYAADGVTVTGEKPSYPTQGESQLLYHGMPVNSMKYEVDANGQKTNNILWYNFDPVTGAVKNDPLTGSPYNIPYNETNYVDIGLGHKVENTADGERVNPETVMQYTYSGIEVFGLGLGDDGLPNNLYNFMGEVVDALRNDNREVMGDLLNHLPDVRSTLLQNLTQIGVRSNFLNDMEGIHTADELNYQTRQRDIEAADLPEESMYNKNHEMAWMVTLQMGSKVLPTSLFDFMR